MRVARLEESAHLLRRLFDGEEVTFKGAHYEVAAHRLFPARRPRLLIGGNGDRVLGLGAEVADIVGFTGLGRTLPDGQRHTTEWEPDQIDAKAAVVRAAAGSRLDQLEFNALVQYVEITDDRGAVAEAVAKRMDSIRRSCWARPSCSSARSTRSSSSSIERENAGASPTSSRATPSRPRASSPRSVDRAFIAMREGALNIVLMRFVTVKPMVVKRLTLER